MNHSQAKSSIVFIPQAGYCGRMKNYLAEMYPAGANLLLAALLYGDMAWVVRRLHPAIAPTNLLFTAIGIGSIFTVGLMVRMMDELKDEVIDRQMFPHRPLPSGRVLESDLGFSIAMVMALYLVANSLTGTPFWFALAVQGLVLLQYRYFFVRDLLESSLSLTLVASSPLFPMLLISAAVMAAAGIGVPWNRLDAVAIALVVSMFSAMFLATEIARKIRTPQEETAYDTYSKIWGVKAAVLVAAVAQTWALAIGVYLYRRWSLSWLFLCFLLIGYAMVCYGYAVFLIRRTPRSARLKGYAQAYVLMVLAALGLELGLGS